MYEYRERRTAVVDVHGHVHGAVLRVHVQVLEMVRPLQPQRRVLAAAQLRLPRHRVLALAVLLEAGVVVADGRLVGSARRAVAVRLLHVHQHLRAGVGLHDVWRCLRARRVELPVVVELVSVQVGRSIGTLGRRRTPPTARGVARRRIRRRCLCGEALAGRRRADVGGGLGARVAHSHELLVARVVVRVL